MHMALLTCQWYVWLRVAFYKTPYGIVYVMCILFLDAFIYALVWDSQIFVNVAMIAKSWLEYTDERYHWDACYLGS